MQRPHPRWSLALFITSSTLLLLLGALAAADAVRAATPTPTPLPPTTPTPDPTVATLEKEKLAQEVRQLQNQNDNSLSSLLRSNITTLVTAAVGLVGIIRWFGDRRAEREKRAEERFQKVVEGLGSDNEGTRIGAAITLRTFLNPGYEQFYAQVFNLTVGHLRLQFTEAAQASPSPLSQALTVAFKESFPRARRHLGLEYQGWFSRLFSSRLQRRQNLLDASELPRFSRLSRAPARWERRDLLDATGVHLQRAYLVGADLKRAWMANGDLREANLFGANLSGAELRRALLSRGDLGQATLAYTNLSYADLSHANLLAADLTGANLAGALLIGANLDGALLREVDLSWADLTGANLAAAELQRAYWRAADFTGANLDGARLWGAVYEPSSTKWPEGFNPEAAGAIPRGGGPGPGSSP